MNDKENIGKSRIVSVASLAVVALVIALGLAFLNQQTRAKIAENLHAYEMRQLKEILQNTVYDNDVFNDYLLITSNQPDAQLLGPGDQHAIFRVTSAGQPRAAILQVTAARGYSGPIELLVGIFSDGSLAGVRVTRHRETPGLGDLIEAEKSSWIHQFQHQSVDQPNVTEWKVKRDGGQFDQITGATVTPRAVVTAVRDALLYFNSHQQEIFSLPQHTAHSDRTHRSHSTLPSALMARNH